MFFRFQTTLNEILTESVCRRIFSVLIFWVKFDEIVDSLKI